jgi:hypothetical protein
MGWVGTLATAAATIYSVVTSTRQAKRAEARQDAYYKQIKASEEAAAEEEKRLALESKEREKQYAAGLIAGNTLLDNNITGNYSEEDLGSSLLTSDLTSGTNTNDIFA